MYESQGIRQTARMWGMEVLGATLIVGVLYAVGRLFGID